MEFITENPMLMVAIVVFLVCVIIGFFGDRRMKKQKEIEKEINNNTDENNKVKAEELTKTQEAVSPNKENASNVSQNNAEVANELVYPTNPGAVVDNQNVSNQVNQDAVLNNPANNLNNNVFETASEIAPDTYPPENRPQGVPEPFDGTVQTDENINNMF